MENGNVITSRTPPGLPHFTRALITCLDRGGPSPELPARARPSSIPGVLGCEPGRRGAGRSSRGAVIGEGFAGVVVRPSGAPIQGPTSVSHPEDIRTHAPTQHDPEERD